MMFVRPPVVAGKFYDIDAELLKKQIGSSLKSVDKKRIVKKKFNAAVVPHAGYMYSGRVSAEFYSLLGEGSPKNYIILGPNHSLAGSQFAVMNRGMWKTPLGGVPIHEEMAKKIEDIALVENDFIPHQYEHSIEVQLPFLQYVIGDGLRFVPVSIKSEVIDESLLDSCRKVGNDIVNIIKTINEPWMIIATSDMSHYIPKDLAEDIDDYVLKPVLTLNEKKFFSHIVERNAGICGAGAVATAITIAKGLGSRRGKLLKYSTSAETTGDESAVVGYASIIM